MILGDIFELHSRQWMCVDDLAPVAVGWVLATPYPLDSHINQVVLMEVFADRSARRAVDPIGEHQF